jgi:hypothetical protein
MPWTDDFGQGTVKLIGLLELLAAVGLSVRAVRVMGRSGGGARRAGDRRVCRRVDWAC